MKKEHQLLFNAPMVCATLEGHKTKTRRVVKDFPLELLQQGFTPEYVASAENGFCPYGNAGDQLWVREACCAEELDSGLDGVRYKADGAWIVIENTREAADEWVALNHYRGKRGATVPSIHMPRWASRIQLEVVSVRIERLLDISPDDCEAEGIQLRFPNVRDQFTPDILRGGFFELWESINGPDSCKENPWLWVVEFKVLSVKGRG